MSRLNTTEKRNMLNYELRKKAQAAVNRKKALMANTVKNVANRMNAMNLNTHNNSYRSKAVNTVKAVPLSLKISVPSRTTNDNNNEEVWSIPNETFNKISVGNNNYFNSNISWANKPRRR